MEKLVQGVHDFKKEVFAPDKALFEKLGDGQEPDALFITCSDSRVTPNQLTQAKPGELFTLRNAGNLVPAYGAGDLAGEATIEYAVAALKVKDIIICGHAHCGAVTGLLHPEKVEGMTAVQAWLSKAETTRRIMAENYGHVTDPAKRLTAAIEENVLVQLENLRTHPSVAAALGRGEVGLHGWVYAFDRGIVFSYDGEQFVPLAQGV